jgi:hypothetical protein
MTRTAEPKERTRPRVSAHRAPAPLWRRWQQGLRWPGWHGWPSWDRRKKLGALAAAGLAAVALVVVLVVAFIAPQRTGSAAGGALGASSGNSEPITVHHRALRVTPEEAVASIKVPPHLAAALKRWDAGPGGAALAEVSKDLGSATQDAGVRLYNPMKQACVSLAGAITAAKAAPPIPGAAMQKSYGLALTKLSVGAADCRAGISVYPYGDEDVKTYENPARLHRSLSELAAGARDLYLATVDLEAVQEHSARK